jgi:mobilization protein NikA
MAKDERLELRLSKEQKASFKASADLCGLTVAQWIMSMCTDKPKPELKLSVQQPKKETKITRESKKPFWSNPKK